MASFDALTPCYFVLGAREDKIYLQSFATWYIDFFQITQQLPVTHTTSLCKLSQKILVCVGVCVCVWGSVLQCVCVCVGGSVLHASLISLSFTPKYVMLSPQSYT